MSVSVSALNLANIIVLKPNKNNINSKFFGSTSESRKSKYTPAVTKVEEWTREDTGVGAAIAAGSHALKGIWALLVIAPKINNKVNKKPVTLNDCIRIILKFLLKRPQARALNKNPSPNRLEKKVKRPAFKAFELL